MLSHILSTPSARLLLLSMSSMPSRDKAALFTVSVVRYGVLHGSSAMLLTMGAQWEWVLLSGVIVSYGYGGLRHS